MMASCNVDAPTGVIINDELMALRKHEEIARKPQDFVMIDCHQSIVLVAIISRCWANSLITVPSTTPSSLLRWRKVKLTSSYDTWHVHYLSAPAVGVPGSNIKTMANMSDPNCNSCLDNYR